MIVNIARRIAFLPVVVVVVPLLISCASSETQRRATDEPVGAEQYLDILLPGFATLQDLDQLEPELYGSLVDRFREGGLEALSETDRTELLRVAELAFLSHAETVRYRVTSRDVSLDGDVSHDGEATVEEVYARRSYSSAESTVSHLEARRVSMDHICWTWALFPYWDPECRGESRLLVEFLSGPQPSDVDTVIMTDWANVDGQWLCYRSAPASGYRYYAAELDYWGLFVRIAKGVLIGRDMLHGEPAYWLEDYDVRSVRYWLDAESLWLRQIEYEEDGIRYTVNVEAINEDIRIEPPDVDVECEAEDAST